MRVLYITTSPKIGGSVKSLSEMYRALPEGAVQGIAICPRGETATEFRRVGMEVIEAIGISKWNETAHGYYRGARWLTLFREIFYFPSTLLALLRASRRPFDVIHVNDIDCAYIGGILKWLTKKPLVVHVRCVLREAQSSVMTRHLERFLEKNADQVVAIDGTVERSISPRVRKVVIHNGLNILHVDRRSTRGANDRPMRVASVAGLIPAKGVMELAEAARLCRERNLDVEFWVVGENPRNMNGILARLLQLLDLSRDVRAELESFVRGHGLQRTLLLKGFIADVAKVYGNVDVLCFPSHLDAPGRSVFEAAYFGVPSIVAVKNPTFDTIVPGETGICIPRPEPRLLADAVEQLYRSPSERRRMGENANKLAVRYFDIKANAATLATLYRSLAATVSHA